MGIVFLRSLFLYIILIVVMRASGKRQIGQLQPHELALTLIVAELIAAPITEADVPLWHGLIPIASLFIVESFVTYFSLKSHRFRSCISGSPSILIENGVISQSELRKQRITLTDLEEQMREEGIDSFRHVRLAILETNGRFSFFLDSQTRPVTPSDLSLQPQDAAMWSVILDGRIDTDNLQRIQRDTAWLTTQLKKRGYASASQIFHAESDGAQLFLQERSSS